MKNNEKIKKLITCGLFAALLSVLSPWSLTLGVIPVTLATFAVYLCGALLPPGRALAACGVYLALGGCGVPVFSGFRGGIFCFLSPTGGYLLGYLPCVLLVSLIIRARHRRPAAYPVAMIAGTVALYLCGTVWYCIVSGVPPLPALQVCVLPFLPGDAMKIAVASVLAAALNKRRLI